jgi:hypothetical protein
VPVKVKFYQVLSKISKIAEKIFGCRLIKTHENRGVPDATLISMKRRRPRLKQYLERGRRGGILAKRWNLIHPKEVFELGDPDER